jgi:hypothetical protein
MQLTILVLCTLKCKVILYFPNVLFQVYSSWFPQLAGQITNFNFNYLKHNGPQNIKYSKSGAEFEFWKICRFWGKGGPKFLDVRFGIKKVDGVIKPLYS